MDQSKELRSLYIKGLLVGNKCKIQLQKPIGLRNEEGAYVHYAEKGDIVEATIFQGVDKVYFKVPVGAQHVLIELSEGKVR